MKQAEERRRLICLILKTKKQRICLRVRLRETFGKRMRKKNAAYVSTTEGATVRLLVQMTMKGAILAGGRNVKSEFAISC